MKVLINALSARQGGGQTYLYNLLGFMPADTDAEVHVLAPASLALPEAANIKRVDAAAGMDNPYSRALWERMQLPALARSLGADILFCPGGLIGARAPRGCKTVTMFRNMIPFDPVQRRRYPLGRERLRNWLLEREMLGSMLGADLVIFVSDFARAVIERRAGKILTNAVTIPHGIGPQFRAREDTVRPAWLPADEYLLYVSTLDVYKAQVEVVQAYALLKQRRGTRAKLVLAGPENPEYGARVRTEIERSGLQQDVIVTGKIPYLELPALYRHAAVNIFASESENCPNILLEALAAGRPVLSSSRPPMPEFGADAALYFDPAAPEQLARLLSRVLDDPALAQRLSAQALARSQLYDWNETARRTWEALAALHRPAA